jgi:hypothetical protein
MWWACFREEEEINDVVQDARTQSSKLGTCSCSNQRPHQLAPLIMLLADTNMESPSVQAIHLQQRVGVREAEQNLERLWLHAVHAHFPSQYHSAAPRLGAQC